MSDLFMNMHRRRRWRSHQTPSPTSTIASPSSTPYNTSDHTFSHHNSNTDGEDATRYVNYNNSNEKEAEDDIENNVNDDPFSNILSLKLRKPENWKWELSTSKSCSNIALPRILLYDHKGQLLVDAQNGDERVYRQDDQAKTKLNKSKKRSHDQQEQQTQQQSQYQQRSATTNLTHSIRKALEKEFNGLQIQEATPSPSPDQYSQTSNTHNTNRLNRSRNPIELNTTDLPDHTLSRRSSSLRGVRFNVKDDHSVMESQMPEFLPTPPSTTTTPTSSSSGPQEKRKYRRSQSSGRSSAQSESILERFSYQKGRFSSPEYAEEQEVKHAPRYFLRTSKAGTLIVQEDSFRHHPLRRRRRPHKNRSTESLQSMQKSHLSSTPSIPQQQSANNSPTCSEINGWKQQPIRRYMSDGNILLNKQLSTSEEDVAVAVGQKQLMDNVNLRHLRKYAQARNQTKDLNYCADVHQNGKIR